MTDYYAITTNAIRQQDTPDYFHILLRIAQGFCIMITTRFHNLYKISMPIRPPILSHLTSSPSSSSSSLSVSVLLSVSDMHSTWLFDVILCYDFEIHAAARYA